MRQKELLDPSNMISSATPAISYSRGGGTTSHTANSHRTQVKVSAEHVQAAVVYHPVEA